MIAGIVLLAALAAQSAAAPGAERVVAVRVHGNHTTPDAEILHLAGVQAGQASTPALPGQVRARLAATGRFRHVEVRKRFASVADPSAVLLVIVVEEHEGIAVDVPRPGPLRKLRAKTMWLPIVRSDDGYGLTYGARVSLVDVAGRRTRLSAPLTWGGERRASVEVERRFTRGPVTRVVATGGIWRREHPALDTGDRRTGAGLRAEKAVAPWLRVGAGASLADIRFGAIDDRLTAVSADLIVDTRTDPAFPRNAAFLSLAAEQLRFDAAGDTTRVSAEARGFLGLLGSTVLAVRAQYVGAADPLPVYEQALLGGDATLRGFRLGDRLGDRLVAGSAELRVPLSTPRQLTKLGVAFFADTGTVYGAGESLDAASWDTGVGAGVFVQAPIFGLRLDVARGLGSGTRVHFSLGSTF